MSDSPLVCSADSESPSCTSSNRPIALTSGVDPWTRRVVLARSSRRSSPISPAPLHDLPSPHESGTSGSLCFASGSRASTAALWRSPIRRSSAGPATGSASSTRRRAEQPAVLLFGTPSAVIASPAAPALIGKAVEELRFQQALLLVPFQPFRTADAPTERTVGEVVGIYISEVKTGPMQAIVAVTALTGRGLEGDRYAAKAGTFTPARTVCAATI